MRPLAVICESSHAAAIEANLRAFCHPAVFDEFVYIMPVDTDTDYTYQAEKMALIAWMLAKHPGTSQQTLLCYTRDAERKVSVRAVAASFGIDTHVESLRRLTQANRGKGSSVPVQQLLNQCNLSLRAVASDQLKHWNHATIDRDAVDQWLAQFSQLGNYGWIGEALLAQTNLIQAATLGNLYADLAIDSSYGLAYNRDARGTAKSGEVIATLLTKRFGTTVYDAPAKAIEAMPTGKLAVFEDGLWSGTEAMGVIESLLGERPGREKTAPLKQPELLARADLTFIYGIATDYGIAVVKRFCRDKGLENIKVMSAQTLLVAPANLLDGLACGKFDLAKMREAGPAEHALVPHIVTALGLSGMAAENIDIAREFCTSVGRQLFEHYLQAMVMTRSWTMWSQEKLAQASLGMHGLGLTQAFAHSIPKATLPLFWASGDVLYNGRRLRWKPLFVNS